MDNNFEKRFEYLKSKTKEELLAELKETKEDLEYLKESLDDKTVSVVQKSEYKNTDIPYDRDKIRFIEEELESRTLK